MVNMSAVCYKYRYSVKPFLIVPIIGAMCADLINTGMITLFLNIIGALCEKNFHHEQPNMPILLMPNDAHVSDITRRVFSCNHSNLKPFFSHTLRTIVHFFISILNQTQLFHKNKG